MDKLIWLKALTDEFNQAEYIWRTYPALISQLRDASTEEEFAAWRKMYEKITKEMPA